jgi:hypothetical protein
MRVLHEGIFKGAFQGDEMDAKPSVLYAYGEEKRERERTKDNAGSDNNTNPQTRFRCQLREPSRKKKKKNSLQTNRRRIHWELFLFVVLMNA